MVNDRWIEALISEHQGSGRVFQCSIEHISNLPDCRVGTELSKIDAALHDGIENPNVLPDLR